MSDPSRPSGSISARRTRWSPPCWTGCRASSRAGAGSRSRRRSSPSRRTDDTSGALAKRQAITNPEGTVFAAKRLIGRRWGSQEVEDARKVLPYALVPGPAGNDVRVELGGRAVSVPELSALVLAELKADAEAFLGRPVARSRHGPGILQRRPAAGHEGRRPPRRPRGAAHRERADERRARLRVRAPGAGQGRRVRPRRRHVRRVRARHRRERLRRDRGGRDTYLGGEDFDRRVMDWLTFGFAKRARRVDLRQDKMALQRARRSGAGEVRASSAASAAIHLPFLLGGGGGKGALHLDRQLSRDGLEELTKDLVDRCVAVTERTCSRTPGSGAGGRGDPRRWDDAHAARAARARVLRSRRKGVHPDEVVALGAAIQAHALSAPAKGAEVLLLDVTPQNLGLLLVGGYFQTVIPKNTTVPTSQTHLFTTVQDDQTSVRIAVLQGESERAIENELLGEFVLDGIRPARRGEVSIEVAFEISADGSSASRRRTSRLGSGSRSP